MTFFMFRGLWVQKGCGEHCGDVLGTWFLLVSYDEISRGGHAPGTVDAPKMRRTYPVGTSTLGLMMERKRLVVNKLD